MQVLQSILKVFVSADVAPQNYEEDFESVSFSTSANIVLPSAERVKDAWARIPAGDVLHLDVTVGENEPVSFHSNRPENIDEELTFLEGILRLSGQNPPCRLNFSIVKAAGAQRNIYKTTALLEWLEALPLKDVFVSFASLFNGGSAIQFFCFDLLDEFESETLAFTKPASGHVARTTNINRETILARRNELCHCENASEIQVIQDDFYLTKRSSHQLAHFLDRACAALCVVYITDVSRFETNGRLSFKLKGYKSITGEIAWRDVSGKSAGVLFKVYRWIYEGGIAADKAGLARNLISLHSKGLDITNVDEHLYDSITSGYQIYLKDNVKQYIEVKNKLIDFLTELSRKASKLGEELGNTLAKNFVAFVSFFLSVLVVKAVSDKDFTGSFTPKVAAIAYALLCASLAHLVGSVLMLNREVRVMGTAYGNIRKRYADLLDKRDLDAVFNKDDEYNLTVQTIRFKRNLYGSVWLVYLLIFTFLVAYLSEPKESSATDQGHTNGAAVITNSTLYLSNSPTLPATNRPAGTNNAASLTSATASNSQPQSSPP